MRSQKRKRGAKRAEEVHECSEAPKWRLWSRPMISTDQQAAASYAKEGEHSKPTRGRRQRRAFEPLNEVTRETQSSTQGSVKRQTSVKSENGGSSDWESEMPI